MIIVAVVAAIILFVIITIVVVGRQTDGKSALIEALMGFQFNHVGGGTKTRKPIALQMEYQPACEQPVCYLRTSDGERKLTLELSVHREAAPAHITLGMEVDGAEPRILAFSDELPSMAADEAVAILSRMQWH